MKDTLIVAEIVSLLFCAIILYGSIFEIKQRTKKKKAFIRAFLINMMGLAADLMTWLIDDKVSEAVLNILTWFSLAAVFMIFDAYVVYLYCHISEKKPDEKYGMYRFCRAFSWFFVVMTVFFSLNGKLFTCVNGIYHEGPAYSWYVCASIFLMLLSIALVVRSAGVLGLHDSAAFSSYTVIPISIELLFYSQSEYSFMYVALALAFTLMYGMFMSDNERRLMHHAVEVTKKANQDELTGLLNRYAFVQYCDSLQGLGKIGAVFCDVNGLKYTNDHYGHKRGDDLIREAAQVMTACFRKESIFRVSGDEFVILVRDISEDVFWKRTEDFRRKIEENPVPLLSIGGAYGTEWEAYQLMEMAEKDMYIDKKKFHERFPEQRRE